MLRFWSSKYVQHLEAEIAWLRVEAQKAQQRYEVACAELVRLQTGGQAAIQPRPLLAPTEDAVRAELEELTKTPDWAQAGS